MENYVQVYLIILIINLLNYLNNINILVKTMSEIKGCVLGDDTIGYDCRTDNVNFQNRENSEVKCRFFRCDSIS